ncbi:MAG: DUF2231 domain-containing protein [Acidobacteriota bacterium]
MGFLPDPLHPAIIHFPIVLALVAFLFEALARHPRGRSLESAAVVLVVLAALGAVAAVVTGNMAHDEAVIPAGARAILEQHEELGEQAMWVLIVLATTRVILAWRRRFTGWLPWVYLLLAAVAAGMVSYNGRLGGEMVFDHGVGTAPVQHGWAPVSPPDASAPPRGDRHE